MKASIFYLNHLRLCSIPTFRCARHRRYPHKESVPRNGSTIDVTRKGGGTFDLSTIWPKHIPEHFRSGEPGQMAPVIMLVDAAFSLVALFFPYRQFIRIGPRPVE